MRISTKLILILLPLVLMGCGIRSIPKAKNQVEASAAEVINQYKRRADLIPNLVNVVQGYAKHERETLQAVVEARAKATSTKIDASSLSSGQMQQFQQAQGSLTQALSKLMVVVEKYPDLKADRNFRELQAQLEGTENRITVARNRNIEAIKNYNNQITVPPESIINSIIYKYEKMPQWSVSEEEKAANEKAPEVNF